MSVFGNLATWWFWAYYATGLIVMTATLTIHLRVGGIMSRRSLWLIVAGGALGALGSIIGGMQAGRYPPMHADLGVLTIRLLWVTGITLGEVACGLYLWGLKEKRQ